MIKLKKSIYFCILLLISIVLDWEKWNIGDKTSILLINFIQLLVVIILAILFIWSVIMLVENFKRLKLRLIFPLIAMLFVIGSFTFLPVCDAGMKINYIFNNSARENVVDMLNRGELGQVDMNEFALPAVYRLTSHPGRIFVEFEELYTQRVDKVLFYVHCGWRKSSAIIYSADDRYIKDGDFGRNYLKVKKLKTNWYCCYMD